MLIIKILLLQFKYHFFNIIIILWPYDLNIIFISNQNNQYTYLFYLSYKAIIYFIVL